MAFDITKAEISGPCLITFAGIVLGHTLDGVELTAERELTEVNVDRYGHTPVDLVLSGNHLKVKFKLAQTEFDQWNAAIPETSSYDGAGIKDRSDFGADAGYSLRGDAAPLVIHPLKNAPADLSDDVTIYLAVSSENVPLPMKIDEQKTLEVTFTALVSEAYGSGRRLGHYGPADVS
jgi:hypothetical protein